MEEDKDKVIEDLEQRILELEDTIIQLNKSIESFKRGTSYIGNSGVAATYNYAIDWTTVTNSIVR